MRANSPLIAYGLFFGALVAVSVNNHPTLTLNLVASGIMTIASFLVFLISRQVPARGAMNYAMVGGAVLVAGAAAAVAISRVYDVLWGPNPLRFGMGQNVVMDTAVVFAGWFWTSTVVRLVR